jgi:predicted acyl esterase
MILSGDTLQARYRRSPLEPLPLEPDVPERFEINMLPISMVVPAGHSLRLTVASSDFPAFARNLNTGDPSTLQIATNRIYHDAAHPSHMVLPVLV